MTFYTERNYTSLQLCFLNPYRSTESNNILLYIMGTVHQSASHIIALL